MSSSTSVIAGEWTLLSIALVLVGCRMFTRLHLNRDKLYISDMWLLIAALFALALIICDTLMYRAGTTQNFTDPGTYTLIIRFTQNYWFDVGMYFPKFSIIAFYYKLIPCTHNRMRIALYALTGITVAGFLVTILDSTFWCGLNIQSNWSEVPGACSAYASMTMMRIHWGFNFTTEVLNVLYPMPIVRELKLPKLRDKIGLSVIFGLGLITIAVSIGRFINMVYIGNGFAIYLWATSELCVSIMVVSLTALRPLLRKVSRIITGTNSERDLIYGYGVITNPLRSTGRKRPIHSQGPGMYWRAESRPTSKNSGARGLDGVDTEMNALATQSHVVKIQEIGFPTDDTSSEHLKKPPEASSMA